jgi:hypothetical protein
LDVQTVGIWDNGFGTRVVIFVRLDMFLNHFSGQRGKDKESLVGDVEVGLESTFETPKGRVGEPTDDGFIVDVSEDGISSDLVRAKAKPPQEGTIDVQTSEMTETFDAGGCGIFEVINSMAGDRVAAGKDTIKNPSMGASGATDGAIGGHG